MVLVFSPTVGVFVYYVGSPSRQSREKGMGGSAGKKYERDGGGEGRERGNGESRER